MVSRPGMEVPAPELAAGRSGPTQDFEPAWLERFYLISPASRPPLRVGMLLDSPMLPRCFAAILDHVLRADFTALSLLVYNTPGAEAEERAPRSRLARRLAVLRDRSRRRRLGFSLYEAWDRERHPEIDDPLESVDCSERLRGIETLHVQPITKGFVHRFPPAALDAIRRKDLDVILRFGFNILKGDILHAARYGVWSYHHGDNESYRGGPAYFWELYEDNPLSGVILQVLTEELDAGRILCKGLYATERGLSLARNRYAPYWGSVPFVIKKLHELHARGWDHLLRSSVPDTPYRGMKKLYRTPTNWEMTRWLAPRLLTKAVARPFRAESVQHWRIAVRTGARRLHESGGADLGGFTWIEPPRGHCHADPFVIDVSGRRWLFFEDYVYSRRRAAIACAEISPDGLVGRPFTVLARPYHVSYPFVFEHEGTVYMIPETGGNETVELYRAVDFPHTWQFEKVLYSGKLVDTTLWIENGFFWFFTTVRDPRGGGPALYLFSSRRLDGEWTLHPSSPISTDVRTARGAGAIFRAGGQLYRPCQDSSAGYGSRLKLQRIVTLTPDAYREEPVLTLDPSGSGRLTGVHTYNHSRSTEVIDGSVWAPRSMHQVPADPAPDHADVRVVDASARR